MGHALNLTPRIIVESVKNTILQFCRKILGKPWDLEKQMLPSVFYEYCDLKADAERDNEIISPQNAQRISIKN